jgi:ADP-heptose:LPS heptosyltransferase
VHCQDCPHYDGVDFRILVVKLDAMGDVLRTTAILPGLKEKYPHSHVTWLTRKESIPLFDHNLLVDRVLDCSAESFLAVQAEEFDLVLGLDAAPESARIATLAKGKEKLGFGWHPRGYSFPVNDEARGWYEMGLFDDVKKANRRTYQDIVLGICRLEQGDKEIVYACAPDELSGAEELRKKWKLRPGRPVVGVNAGRRWVNKKWPEAKSVALIRKLLAGGYSVLLLGGPEERELNARIRRKAGPKLVDAGSGHSVREYAAIVNLCDLLVTMDTFTLHLGLGLKKKVVALFGPTSADEIEVYGRGVKLTPLVECGCYYRRECTAESPCMGTITPEAVLAAVEGLLPPAPARSTR